MNKTSIKIIRWSLRILSALFIAFLLIMFIGETFFQDDDLDGVYENTDAILQLSVMGIGLIGLALAWKWELTGGIIALAAYIGLAIINPEVLQFSLLFLYPATAILFVVLWAVSRNTIVKNE